jgi:hypothetical protein
MDTSIGLALLLTRRLSAGAPLLLLVLGLTVLVTAAVLATTAALILASEPILLAPLRWH